MHPTDLYSHPIIDLQLKMQTNSQSLHNSAIIIHQYYTEQPFSAPKNIKNQIKIRDTKKFSQNPSNKPMVDELTDLIPELSEEIKNMNYEQFMQTYTLAMQEKSKVDSFKTKHNIKKPCEQNQKTKNKLDIPFSQPEETVKRSYDVMISHNPPKNHRQILLNKQPVELNKIQYTKTLNQIEQTSKTIKIPKKLTRQTRRNQSDDDFDIEEHIGYKRLLQHNDHSQIPKKTRLQLRHIDSQTYTNPQQTNSSLKRSLLEA